MKQTIIQLIYGILDIFPKEIAEKLKILGCILTGDWHFLPPRSVNIPGERFDKVTLPLLQEIYSGFDQKEIEKAWNYVRRIRQKADMPYPERGLLYNHRTICGDSYADYQRIRKEMKATGKKLHLDSLGEMAVCPEILYYHHGLRFSDPEIREYIRNKIFIDAGAGIGDSALIFLKNYNPSLVYSFELSAKNCTDFRKIMKSNHIDEKQYMLMPVALGAEEGTMAFNDCGGTDASLRHENKALSGTCQEAAVRSLDQIFDTICGKTGFIKADVEGMCLDLVKGAIETIKRDRPVLSLCIYHNQEELLGVYSFLKAENLDYEYHLQLMTPEAESIELVLFGYPKEIK